MFTETEAGKFDYQNDDYFVIVLHDSSTKKLPVIASPKVLVSSPLSSSEPLSVSWTILNLLEKDLKKFNVPAEVAEDLRNQIESK